MSAPPIKNSGADVIVLPDGNVFFVLKWFAVLITPSVSKSLTSFASGWSPVLIKSP